MSGVPLIAPVWRWPESGAAPVQVGELERGRFTYDVAWVAAGETGRTTALDPDELRFTSKLRGIVVSSDLRERIPGVIADAGPDSWGRLLLAQDLGHVPDALEALVRSAADGAGNLAVGDLQAKPAAQLLSLDALAEAIARRQQALAQARPVNVSPGLQHDFQQILSPDTALGGAKPKASLMRDGEEWIAKFPERGDPDCLPFFEATALRVAALCGIEAAQVHCHSFSATRHVLLVRRFDRVSHADGNSGRYGFASALTVMGPQATRFADQYSYPALAQQLGRWVGRARHDEVRAALWQRIAFNALVGNTDDHGRNHALLCRQGLWWLSPAFDIVPHWREATQLSLALPYFRNEAGMLSSQISARQLVLAAPAYGLSAEAACAQLLAMAALIEREWLPTLAQLGAPDVAEVPMRMTLAWTRRLRQEAESLSAADLAPPPKRRRGWGR